MPIVSSSDRAAILRKEEPTLFRLCVTNPLPNILSYRFSTEMRFAYGGSKSGSPIPASWDHAGIHVIPLWESGISMVALRIDSSSRKFVEIDFEDVSDVAVISSTSAGLLGHLFYFLVESADDQDERSEIDSLADYLEFDGLERVKTAAQRARGQAAYTSLAELVASLDAEASGGPGR
jgi:hypothetical protein